MNEPPEALGASNDPHAAPVFWAQVQVVCVFMLLVA